MSLIEYTQSNNIEKVKILLEQYDGNIKNYIMMINKQYKSAIMLASYMGHLEIVKLFIAQLRSGSKGNIQKEDILGKNQSSCQTVFYHACIGGNSDVIKLFIDKYNINWNEIHKDGSIDLLYYISFKGLCEILKLIIEQCNVPNKDIINNVELTKRWCTHLPPESINEIINISYNILFKRTINEAINDIILSI